MNIVVLVKQVPDTYAERKLDTATGLLDRAASDAVLDEIDEKAVEAALQLKEGHGGEVTVVSMGPERADEALRKALAMGADTAVRLSDDALAGACAVRTAQALATVIETMDRVDLVLAGNEASDGRSGAVPAMIAELLDLPALTHAAAITVDGPAVTVRRETDRGTATLTADLPAVVSVGEKLNDPRYPSFKGIMSAKKKPLTVLTAADAGSGADEALSTVTSAVPKPPKSAGEKITDDGDGGPRIAAYLTSQKLI